MPILGELWFFLVTFGLLVAAGVGFPIPEEGPVIAAGIWAASNPDLGPSRWLILPVCIVGIVLSDVLLYSIGRFGGARLLQHRWVARLMPPAKREQIEANFAHYGMKVLLVIRWLPGIRSPMFITAGMMRVPLWRFIAADSIAAAMGHTLLFFLAFWFGDQVRDLVLDAEKKAERIIRPILILTILIAVAVYFIIRYLRRPVPTADPKELPLIGAKVAAGIESLEKSSFLGLHKHSETAAQGEQLGTAGSAGISPASNNASGQDGRAPRGNHEPAAREGMERTRPPAGEA
ncbi:MAG TPA: DedA family protein [Gemmataceae bacterium]|nr:DedA family protein [Gemmataceae bacterium]